MSYKACHVKVFGRVTGVGFRWSALEKARTLPSVSGYVRNVGYGEVEAFAQGEPRDVDAMVAWLLSGPPLARVDTFSVSDAPLDDTITRFEVR